MVSGERVFRGLRSFRDAIFIYRPKLWVSDFSARFLPLAYLHNPMIPIPYAIPIANMDEATLSPISVLTSHSHRQNSLRMVSHQ